jgi:hypothetical protein
MPSEAHTTYANKLLAYIARERERNKVLSKTLQNLAGNGVRFNANTELIQTYSNHIKSKQNA